MTTTKEPAMVTTNHTDRAVGTIGLVGAALVAAILGVHPLGTTELYDDGPGFLDHVNVFWVAIHLVAAVAFVTFAPVIHHAAETLRPGYPRALGRFAGVVATLGTALGVLHLVGFDTLTFLAFEDTFAAADGSEASLLGADLLLRLHAASLVSWMMAFWLPVSALLGAALLAEGTRPFWMRQLGPVAAVMQAAAVILFVAEGQHTTLGETVLFRAGVTLLLALVALLAWELRRGAPIGEPAESPRRPGVSRSK